MLSAGGANRQDRYGRNLDERDDLKSAAVQLGSKGGKKRAESMIPERRAEIARKAAEKRWSKQK